MRKSSVVQRNDYDGAWKVALERYLEPFLRLCFPTVHAVIDWFVQLSAEQEIEFRRKIAEYEAQKHTL